MSKELVYLVYDGECPICRPAVAAYDVAEGELCAVDARRAHPILSEIASAGLKIDDGMVLKIGEKLYHGAEALRMSALLGSRRGLLNNLNRLLFRSECHTKLAYPLFKWVRRMAFKLKGINKLGY